MKRKILCTIPAIFIMAAIFFFSSFEGQDSTEQSLMVSFLLAEAGLQLQGETVSPEKVFILAQGIDGYVRKTAHMMEYAILALSVWFALSNWTDRKKVIYFSTALICILYAASDEFHQRFVRFRFGSFEDVMVDAMGITLTIMVLLLIEEGCLKASPSGRS